MKPSNIFSFLFILPITLAPSCDVASPTWTAGYDSILRKHAQKEQSLYIYDLKDIEYSMSIWKYEMPNIKPYYAVKCNPDPGIIQTLSKLGANFDCASPKEIDLVLAQGVSPSRILYANPCKRMCDISYAYAKGVTMTTLDSICELQKIANVAPQMKIIIRIYANDPTAQCVLSNKFGASEDDWESLLQEAKRLHLDVCGISFHVGSGASSPEAFGRAILQSRKLYDLALTYGYHLDIIDIGGGFSRKTIYTISPTIRNSLQASFDDLQSCSFIAEPGRFFAETCAALYTRVIGIRGSCCTITDGLYGSFNNVVYDHATVPQPIVLRADGREKHGELNEITVFGPTCDGFDTVLKCMLPTVSLGDYLVFKNMGAYTIAGACDFNGIEFTKPICVYLTLE